MFNMSVLVLLRFLSHIKLFCPKMQIVRRNNTYASRYEPVSMSMYVYWSGLYARMYVYACDWLVGWV